jgi:hypothetical protein
MEVIPGAEAQVDFGAGAWIVDSDGKSRRSWMLRIVLSHLRKAYSEAVYRQTPEEFIKVIENAFHYFGGVWERRDCYPHLHRFLRQHSVGLPLGAQVSAIGACSGRVRSLS